MILPLQAKAGLAAVLLIAAFGSGWYVRAKIADADMAKVRAELQEAVDAQRAREDAAAASYEIERAGLSRQSTSSQSRVREIYRDIKVPADCAPSPDALRLLDNAIAGEGGATGEPSPAVPANP